MDRISFQEAMERRIQTALSELLDRIDQSDSQRITDGMEVIEGLVQEGRSNLHPQLIHFLERHSYAKALDYLGGGPGQQTDRETPET